MTRAELLGLNFPLLRVVYFTPHWTAEARDEHHWDGGSEQEDETALPPS